jgi:hypothetical protein
VEKSSSSSSAAAAAAIAVLLYVVSAMLYLPVRIIVLLIGLFVIMGE